MIRIFLKLIWSNRKRNILVFIELFMISLVLVNLTFYLVNMVTIFNTKNCYNTDNVVLVDIARKNAEDENVSEISFMNLKEEFRSNPFVESVSINNFGVPFSNSFMSSNFRYDTANFRLVMRKVDIDYGKVLQIKTVKGRWFNETDIGKSVQPVIISRDIDERIFYGNAAGKRIEGNMNVYEIIGVVDHYKRSDFEKPASFCFLFKEKVDATSNLTTSFLIKTREGYTSEMLSKAESQVYSTLNPDKWAIRKINSLENMRNMQNDENSQKNFLNIIIAVFIMVNVFLGTIGILWYNTNLRIQEIGIKRALGSTAHGIKRHIIAENMLFAGLSLLVVSLLLLQIPPFMGGYSFHPGLFFKSICISFVTMIILVLLSSWLPATLAAKIRPATALKME